MTMIEGYSKNKNDIKIDKQTKKKQMNSNYTIV